VFKNRMKSLSGATDYVVEMTIFYALMCRINAGIFFRYKWPFGITFKKTVTALLEYINFY